MDKDEVEHLMRMIAEKWTDSPAGCYSRDMNMEQRMHSQFNNKPLHGTRLRRTVMVLFQSNCTRLASTAVRSREEEKRSPYVHADSVPQA